MLAKDYITPNMRMNYILNSAELSTNEATFAQFIKMVEYIKLTYPRNHDMIFKIQCDISEQTIKDLTFTEKQFRYLMDIYLKAKSKHQKEFIHGINSN